MNETGTTDHGAMRLQTDEDGWTLYVRASRTACLRWSEILAEAAAAPPGQMQMGSEQAEELTGRLSDSIVRMSPISLGEFSLDETLTDAEPVPTRGWKDRLAAIGCALVAFFAVIVVIRGFTALVEDIFGG